MTLYNGCSFPGPDVVEPASKSYTWRRDSAVRLDIPEVDEGGPRSEKPISVITAFRQTVAKLPDHIALGKLLHVALFIDGSRCNRLHPSFIALNV